MSPPRPKRRAEREQKKPQRKVTKCKNAEILLLEWINLTRIFEKMRPLLLISLLVLAVLVMISTQGVKASNAGLMFTPNYHVNNVDPSGEESYSDSVANMITYYFSNYGSNYGYIYNCQDSSASQSQYISSLSYAQNNYYNSVVYSKGHEWTWGGDLNHYEIVANNYVQQGDQNGVRDSQNVYSNTGASDRFVFLWHCGTAMSYPSWQTSDGLGWAGMPYDFTHDNSMSLNGYTSADTGYSVFNGFWQASPEYKTPTSYGSYDYGSFVTVFYQYLLQYHYSVNAALNAASATTLGNSYFGNTPLYQGIDEYVPGMGYYWSYFYTYGNGNLGIPG